MISEANEYKNLGRVIAACGDGGFCGHFVDWLRSHIPFTFATIVVYRGSEPPLHLFDDFPQDDARAGMMKFLTQTYVLNAFYQRHQQGLETGVYRIRDMAPDGYLESEVHRGYEVIISEREEAGYITVGWPKELEEVDIAISLGDAVTAEIGFYQSVDTGGFTDSDLARLGILLPVIEAAFKLHWNHAASHAPQDRRIAGRDAQAAFASFGEGKLTDRERQVVAMILRGHSSESISSHLGISITTVKTHRKRAYEKMDISTQAELMSLFLQHVQGDLVSS